MHRKNYLFLSVTVSLEPGPINRNRKDSSRMGDKQGVKFGSQTPFAEPSWYAFGRITVPPASVPLQRVFP